MQSNNRIALRALGEAIARAQRSWLAALLDADRYPEEEAAMIGRQLITIEDALREAGRAVWRLSESEE